jgi:hypothetical protein
MLPPKKRLLDQVRDRLRLKNYAYRTEKSYLYWIKQYILFHNKRHPNEMGGPEIEQFLTYLATKKKSCCINSKPGPERTSFSLP